jgi:hypothetical protein
MNLMTRTIRRDRGNGGEEATAAAAQRQRMMPSMPPYEPGRCPCLPVGLIVSHATHPDVPMGVGAGYRGRPGWSLIEEAL